MSRFTDAIAFLENYVPRYDIVFMDIQLPDMDGMTASRRLRALDRDVILIFVTNMANYAVSGYEVDALDFIVKPVSYFPFTVKLERALGRLDGNAGGGSVLLSTAEGAVCVRPCDVRYVEVMKHTLIYHTTTGDLTVYGSLKNAESALPAVRFVRCNSCYLVNLRYVKRVTGYTALVGGDELAISHSRRRDFLRALGEYIGKGAVHV